MVNELEKIRTTIEDIVIPYIEKIMLNSWCLDFDEYEAQERYKSDAIYYLKEIVDKLWIINK